MLKHIRLDLPNLRIRDEFQSLTGRSDDVADEPVRESEIRFGPIALPVGKRSFLVDTDQTGRPWP
jgi:hypothetical protein